MIRGEVRWYAFKAPDKRRPVLVLTRDSAIPVLTSITVAPLTTTIRDIPTEVILGPSDGIPRDCAVNLDNVQTVAKANLGERIALLGSDRMQAVAEALSFALDIGRH